MIEIFKTKLDGVLEVRPKKFGDDRGFFSETYHAQRFSDVGIPAAFVQDNQSYSAATGVLRGLHYQLDPHAQGKLVRVTKGRIFDVAVDIRRGSPTFAQWVGVELSEEGWNQLYIPAGFAHGFLTLVPSVEVVYKVTDYYAPECDRSIRFDDPTIGVNWPFSSTEVHLSEKDRNAPLLTDADVFDFRS